MAVYKRSYTPYQGVRTHERLRFTVVTRYALKTVLSTKLAISAFTFSFVPHLVALCLIYLRNNVAALTAIAPGLPATQIMAYFPIDGPFFARLLGVEAFLTFGLVSLIGPGLISPDLANNALPLYLSRPFSRFEYVLGKLSALLVLLSLVTWIPGSLLIGVQTSLAGFEWLGDHRGVVAAVLVGSWLWILAMSLVSLAISAWVRWGAVAVPALFGVFFVAAAFGEVANDLLDLNPRWGTLINLPAAMAMVWNWLATGDWLYSGTDGAGIPAWTGLVSILGFCGLSTVLLIWKVRASEIVR